MFIFLSLQEGPHSALNDDEFYDAVESGLDKIDEEIEFRERLKLSRPPICSKATEHPLWSEVCFLYVYCHFYLWLDLRNKR